MMTSERGLSLRFWPRGEKFEYPSPLVFCLAKELLVYAQAFFPEAILQEMKRLRLN